MNVSAFSISCNSGYAPRFCMFKMFLKKISTVLLYHISSTALLYLHSIIQQHCCTSTVAEHNTAVLLYTLQHSTTVPLRQHSTTLLYFYSSTAQRCSISNPAQLSNVVPLLQHSTVVALLQHQQCWCGP